MTDEALLFEIRRRIARCKAKRLTVKALREKLGKVAKFDQVESVCAGAVRDGKLRVVNGELYEPDRPPAFGAPLPPQKKTKAQLKKEAPLPGQLSFGSDD